MEHHPESKRLNKAIGDSGFCSRRQADVHIEKGEVTINGKVATLGDRVMPGDDIRIQGKKIQENDTDVYIAFNKPVGITCTGNPKVKDNVIDYINHPERIFYIGRLDKPSEGLLLLTNDGDIVNKILRAGNEHEKEYVVFVDKPITQHFLRQMRNGVPILDTVTKKCEVKQLSRYSFNITLIQGLNRQIRRMCNYLGYEVVSLKRVRVMNIELGELPTGHWRNLTQEELITLKKALRDSDNSPEVERSEKRIEGKRRRR